MIASPVTAISLRLQPSGVGGNARARSTDSGSSSCQSTTVAPSPRERATRLAPLQAGDLHAGRHCRRHAGRHGRDDRHRPPASPQRLDEIDRPFSGQRRTEDDLRALGQPPLEIDRERNSRRIGSPPLLTTVGNVVPTRIGSLPLPSPPFGSADRSPIPGEVAPDGDWVAASRARLRRGFVSEPPPGSIHVSPERVTRPVRLPSRARRRRHGKRRSVRSSYDPARHRASRCTDARSSITNTIVTARPRGIRRSRDARPGEAVPVDPVHRIAAAVPRVEKNSTPPRRRRSASADVPDRPILERERVE